MSQVPKNISYLGKTFVGKCLDFNYRKRSTVAALLKDPWVTRPNLNAGIRDVLKQVFVANSFQNIGFG